MNIFEKLTQFTENIIETVPKEQFMYIFIWGMVWITFYNFMFTIIAAIENKLWIIKDYEKVITKYINTHDAENIKDLDLIVKAKSNVKKRIKNKEKLKRLFKKGNKNGEK